MYAFGPFKQYIVAHATCSKKKKKDFLLTWTFKDKIRLFSFPSDPIG
jgi:hypothetical protein